MPIPQPLSYDATGLTFTEKEEGCSLMPYQDSVGVWTEGYGHTGADVVPGIAITQAQADTLLAQDIQAAVDAVNRLVDIQLTQEEFDALVDFVYNLGIGAFAESTLLKLVNKSDFVQAADEFEKWDHAGGVVLAGLMQRRLAEREMFQGK
jgi:lysozyme